MALKIFGGDIQSEVSSSFERLYGRELVGNMKHNNIKSSTLNKIYNIHLLSS
jgi:hypothetical protein